MKAYLLGLTAAAIFAAVVRRLAPASGAGKAARMGAGLLVILTALGPLGTIDLTEAAERIAIAGYGDILTTVPVDKAANTLLEELITDSAEAYILDKAQELGAKISPSVFTDSTSGYPVPYSVSIIGEYTQMQKNSLMVCIRDELGIPEDRQEW